MDGGESGLGCVDTDSRPGCEVLSARHGRTSGHDAINVSENSQVAFNDATLLEDVVCCHDLIRDGAFSVVAFTAEKVKLALKLAHEQIVRADVAAVLDYC